MRAPAKQCIANKAESTRRPGALYAVCTVVGDCEELGRLGGQPELRAGAKRVRLAQNEMHSSAEPNRLASTRKEESRDLRDFNQ